MQDDYLDMLVFVTSGKHTFPTLSSRHQSLTCAGSAIKTAMPSASPLTCLLNLSKKYITACIHVHVILLFQKALDHLARASTERAFYKEECKRSTEDVKRVLGWLVTSTQQTSLFTSALILHSRSTIPVTHCKYIF